MTAKTEESASPGPLHTDPAQFLKAADLKALFPPGSKAHLLRSGFVNCHSGDCELVLSPFDGVTTLNLNSTPAGTPVAVHKLPLTH